MLQLEVEDTGIGIEAQAQQRVFERFYRVDKARSRDLGGTGLGLSIVKHIAEEHGGTVQLDSEPGRGSRFVVKFPLGALTAFRKSETLTFSLSNLYISNPKCALKTHES